MLKKHKNLVILITLITLIHKVREFPCSTVTPNSTQIKRKWKILRKKVQVWMYGSVELN